MNNSNLNINFNFLSEQLFYCNINGCIFKICELKNIYKLLFEYLLFEYEFCFWSRCTIYSFKKCILKKSKNFYMKFLKLLEYCNDSIEGHAIERFYCLILNNGNYLNRLNLNVY